MANRRLRLIAGLLILASLGLVIAIQPSRPPGPPALPQPNGYDDFIEAGALLTGGTEDYLTMDAAQLRALTQRNAAALARMRVGLTRECRVPMDTSATRGHAVAELPTQKRLVRAVLAEGRLAELERHPSDAAARCVEALRLSHEAARGGLLLEHLVSLSAQSLALGQLQTILPSLDARTCRQLIHQLETIESRREPAEETLRMERLWFSRAFDFWQRLQYRLLTRSLDPTRAEHSSYLTRLQALMARQTQLRLALARQADQLDHGPPATDAPVPPGK